MQQQQQAEAPNQPSPIEIIRQIAREEQIDQTRQYAEWAQRRKEEQEAATLAWQADKDLAPWLPIAQAEYVQIDNMFNGSKPVAEVVDLVKRKILGLKAQGVQPPAPKKPAFGGVRSDYDIPVGDGMSGQYGFRAEDPAEKMKRNHAYLRDRQIDNDKRKFRGDESDWKRLEELREAQYTNRVAVE